MKKITLARDMTEWMLEYLKFDLNSFKLMFLEKSL